jgi:hypothetical protein
MPASSAEPRRNVLVILHLRDGWIGGESRAQIRVGNAAGHLVELQASSAGVVARTLVISGGLPRTPATPAARAKAFFLRVKVLKALGHISQCICAGALL